MITIKEIYLDEVSVAITFSIQSRFRKKGSELLTTILTGIISENLSREIEIESSWVYEATKKLEKTNNKSVKHFIVNYQFKRKSIINMIVVFE